MLFDLYHKQTTSYWIKRFLMRHLLVSFSINILFEKLSPQPTLQPAEIPLDLTIVPPTRPFSNFLNYSYKYIILYYIHIYAIKQEIKDFPYI